MLNETTAALIGAMLAFIASLYVVRFRRFVAEQWWSRRADAYSRIIETLSLLLDYHRKHYDNALGLERFSAEEAARRAAQWRELVSEITKATHVGAFVISERAAKALKTREHDANKDEAESEEFDHVIWRHVEATKKCLTEMIAAAQEDLEIDKLRSRRWWRFWR